MKKLLKSIYKLIGRPCWMMAGKRVWYRYLLPCRLTMKHNPAIYRWLFWGFGWDERVGNS